MSCGITSAVEMHPGDIIFTSGGTQLVTDISPMCRNNVRLQQRDENYKTEYFKKSRMGQWLMQYIRCQKRRQTIIQTTFLKMKHLREETRRIEPIEETRRQLVER